jgi:hypothetical protein
VIGGVLQFSLEGAPGSPYVVALDFAPGAVSVPGLGLVHLALTPNFLMPLNSLLNAPPIPASGVLNLPIPILGTDGTLAYVQSAVAGAGSPSLTNAKSLQWSLPDSYHSTFSSMTQPRAFHRSVPLSNGSVLIVGGGSGAFLTPVATAQCDRYNPYTRLFAADAPMGTPRTLHTATLLMDGRVLVTGGSLTLGVGINNTELYDPALMQWTSGPNMSITRIAHTATRLPDGRVLLAGGTSTFNIPVGSTNYLPIFQGSLASAEIYDPSTGLIAPTGNLMSQARMAHAAVNLADGRVLLCGGIRGGQTVFGVGAPLYAQTADIFDPATNLFTSVTGPTIPRVTHTADLLPDGRVLMIGGAGGTLVATLSTSEIWDPSNQSWSAGPALSQGTLALHTTTALPDGSLYVGGGAIGAVGSFQAVADAYRYSTTGGLVPLQGLPVALQALTSLWTDEGVLIVGGGLSGSSGSPTDAAWLWTPNL